MQRWMVKFHTVARHLSGGKLRESQRDIAQYIGFIVIRRRDWQQVYCDLRQLLGNWSGRRAFDTTLESVPQLPRHRHERSSLYSSVTSSAIWRATICSSSPTNLSLAAIAI